jgi:hypothetical protein
MQLAIIIKRIVIALIVFSFVIVILGPLLLYWGGLFGVNGRPEPSSLQLTESEREYVWRKVRGSGEPKVIPITPYEFLSANAQGDERKPGLQLANWVSRSYLLNGNYEFKRTLLRHLSGAALTIWLTRNWTTDQILYSASELLKLEQANPAFKRDALKRAP